MDSDSVGRKRSRFVPVPIISWEWILDRRFHGLFLFSLSVLPFHFPFYFASGASLHILLVTTSPDPFHLHPVLLIHFSQNLTFFNSFTKTHFSWNIRRSLPIIMFYLPRSVNTFTWLEWVIIWSDCRQPL